MRAIDEAVAAERTDLQGVIDAAVAVLDGGLRTIEGVHTAIARKPFAPLRLAPGVAYVSEGVRVANDGITSFVYAGLRAAIGATGAMARLVAGSAVAGSLAPRPGSSADLAIAAINGFAGDRLARDRNPLATTMSLRHRGRRIALERAALAAAFPDASARLAVFVHGLACNETLWRLHAERHYGNRHTTYGSRLQADLGYTPLYVRYNTGKHIADNGRELALLLGRLVSEWPVPVDELTVIGHSMGGLVARSACHYGQAAEGAWVRLVRHVVFLGSPHRGAPLEKAANVSAWLLGLADVTRPFADALNARSVGIKDLRFGSLRDEEWKGVDLDAFLSGRSTDIPLLERANHYFVAATVTRDPRHPLGVVVGDLLVRHASASGRGRTQHLQFPIEHARHFGPLTHLELLNHPDVYDQLRRWLAPRGC